MLDPPAETVRSPRHTVASFAHSLAPGDINGDRRIDLVTGDYLTATTDIETGIVDAFLGSDGRLGPRPAPDDRQSAGPA